MITLDGFKALKRHDEIVFGETRFCVLAHISPRFPGEVDRIEADLPDSSHVIFGFSTDAGVTGENGQPLPLITTTAVIKKASS